VQAYFACPQDPEQWPDQKKLSTSDPEWLAYFNKMKALGETNGFDLISGMPAPTTD
jgi:hypothetical protein